MIREIFNAITPENIKSNPLYSNFIELFLQTIEKRAQVSLDINEIYKSTDPAVKIQIIKTYLEAFHKILSGIETSNLVGSIYNNVETDILPKIEDILTNEYFLSSKTFKQSKGTKSSIGYVYKLIESLNSFSTGSNVPFKIKDDKGKFYFDVEGNLTAEVYDQIVKPLSHPAGFAYVYTQVLSSIFEDFFNLQKEYNDVILKVKCSNNGDFDFIGLGSVIITGPAVSGSTLTATVSDVNSNFLTNYSYIWKDELNKTLGTSKTLVLTDEEIGKNISVNVKYTETIDGVSYEREVYSTIKTQINGYSTVQVKDTVGRVYITGTAVFNPNLPSSSVQNLRAEIFDSVGIRYNTLKYEWKSNDLTVPVFNEFFPLNINFTNKKISVTVSYTDLAGTPKVITDEIDNTLNYWSHVGSIADYGTAYRIVNISEENLGRKILVRIEFNNGEFLEQIKSSTFTDIKWWSACSIPYDYSSRTLIKDFTTNTDLTQNYCSLDLSYTIERSSLIDDQLVTDIDGASIEDNFWYDVDNIILIGNQLIIGGFNVGTGVSRLISEIISEFEAFYPTFGNYTYSYAGGDIFPVIGKKITITNSGAFIIGTATGLVTIPCDTDEHYNLLESASEIIDIIIYDASTGLPIP